MLVIKSSKRYDVKDFKGKPILDIIPIGCVLDVQGQVPESFIKYIPNKSFDKNKYPELYELLGKSKLPSENELVGFAEKTNYWYIEEKPSLFKRIFNYFFKK